jgi:predicted site-specific integrase-resolvase
MFVPSRVARAHYNVGYETLRRWALNGTLEYKTTEGGHRRFKINQSTEEKAKPYIYARVSSKKQEGDLKTQIEFIKQQYPDYEVISDIGSGINEKRKGYKTLLDKVLAGTVTEIVVAHKDRLSRFSFNTIQYICQKFGTKITVLRDDKSASREEELSKDLMSIITVFSARYHGSRKYAIQSEDTDISEPDSDEFIQ